MWPTFYSSSSVVSHFSTFYSSIEKEKGMKTNFALNGESWALSYSYFTFRKHDEQEKWKELVFELYALSVSNSI